MSETDLSPLISVYIPTRNYAAYLETAIKSVLNQSFSNWELIIVDDSSTDTTREIIDRYASNTRIRPYRTLRHLGLIHASNIALHAARGAYVVRLDADDWLQTFALKEFTRYLNSDPSLDMICPQMITIDRIGGDIVLFPREDKLLFEHSINGAGCLIRKQKLLSIGGYDEDFVCQDGYYLIQKALQENWKIKLVKEAMYIYYQHPTSLSHDHKLIESTRTKIKEKLRS